ncbi:MAG: hypothetical protein ACRDZ7_01920 [Acidimicrobiia bacterium]
MTVRSEPSPDRQYPAVAANQPMKLHDTRHPLTCCPRCHKAELLGRARHRPVFRYEKVEGSPEGTSVYRVFHGENVVATLTKERRSRAVFYEVAVEWEDAGAAGLAAGSLQDARLLAEQAYTVVWREGRYSPRGPVHVL